MSSKIPGELPAAENYATKRIKTLQEKVKEAEKDTETTLKAIHDRFERQNEMEHESQASKRSSFEQKAYEDMKKTKDLVSRQQRKKDFEGKTALQATRDFYDESINYTKKRGDGHVRNLEERNFREMQMINEDAERKVALTRLDQQKRIDQVKGMSDEQFEALREERQRQEAEIKTKNYQSVLDTEKHYGENTKKIMEDNHKNIARLNDKSSDQLRTMQDQYSTKLAAYSDRAHDPFYKMAGVESKVSEDADHYFLIARIPEHEQDHVTVTIKGGNTLVLNGRRTMQDRKETGGGGFVSTAAHQSYTQAFPVDIPVDERAVMKESRGDEVVFTIPKMGRPSSPIYQAHHVDLAKGMKPNFPTDLPIQKAKSGKKLG
ncbi:MAG: hypothetical protein KA715_08030 [Xanthomonadaceae bacterium]|nr:hypothetical protein [Xanthomonadaceae bacterium]